MYLMSICQEGNASKGRRTKKVPAATPGATAPTPKRRLETLADSRRAQCQSRKCANRSKAIKGSGEGKGSGQGKGVGAPKGGSARGARISTACRCPDCATVGGIVMCAECFTDDAKHLSAFEHASSQRKDGGRRTRPRKLEFERDARARSGGGGGHAREKRDVVGPAKAIGRKH